MVLMTAMAACAAGSVRADHPRILATPADRAAIQARIERAPWAKQGYAALRARLDPLVERTQTDPKWLSSRLLMNWETRYTTTLVEKSRTVGGEGRAPVPTPRFEGARNWASDYGLPPGIEDWKPYNDRGGKVWMRNNKTGQMEWVDPGQTGGAIRGAHQRILGLVADAAFVYWITGDEKYARFATEILWTFMEGFYHTRPPKPVSPDPGMMRIIGPTTFEVIHENVVIPVALAYDFLYPFLQKQGKDVTIIQTGLKRFADRVIEGGGREGNWNLHQAMMITYAGLALESNAAYADNKGRPYYVDVVLNADLPAQKGLTRVMEEGFDPKSALWPEAAGYGFGSAAQMVELGLLLSGDAAGRQLLENPLLARSLLNQGELLYPNGLSNGVGDTTNTRLRADALENLIAWARQTGDAALESRLTAYLQREIASGNYDRGRRSDLWALTRYVPQLLPSAAAPAASRSFFFPGLNILMQRSLAAGGRDPAHSLAAALYGTRGGHVHSNGLAIELFGAGHILGADPGRGASYWEAEHGEYYSQPPAHNTVIASGASNYPAEGRGQVAMQIESIEPASQRAAISPNVSFVRASFRYKTPDTVQRRTFALLRVGLKSGFYFDLFRSREDSESPSFHDYLYHNMGQSLTLTYTDGSPIALAPTNTLSTHPALALSRQHGLTLPRLPVLLKGYTYFRNERSAVHPGHLRATFTLEMPDGTKPTMALWMLGRAGTLPLAERTVFAVEAPRNNAIREGLPPQVRDLPMQTLIVRQLGEAWDWPFVAVYEPFLAAEGASVRGVWAARIRDDAPNLAAIVVEGRAGDQPFRVLLFDDDDLGVVRRTEDATFQGEFGAVIERGGAVEELYLGRGRKLGTPRVYLSARQDGITADLRREGGGWRYSASAPITVGLVFPRPAAARDLRKWTIAGATRVQLRAGSAPDGAKIIVATAVLPAAQNRRLVLKATRP